VVAASIDSESASSGWLTGLGAAAATGISFIAWLLIALGAVFGWAWGVGWVYTGVALPAATMGSLASHMTRRRAYFWVGLAVTLIPLVTYVLLEATAPPPPPGWND